MDSSSISSSIHFVCCLCRTVNFKMRNERREDARPCSALKNTFLLLLLLLFLTAFCSYLFISFQWWGEHVEDVEDIFYKMLADLTQSACLPEVDERGLCDVLWCVLLCCVQIYWKMMEWRGEGIWWQFVLLFRFSCFLLAVFFFLSFLQFCSFLVSFFCCLRLLWAGHPFSVFASFALLVWCTLLFFCVCRPNVIAFAYFSLSPRPSIGKAICHTVHTVDFVSPL